MICSPCLQPAGRLYISALAAGGLPPKNQWARDAGGRVYILHVHGPKLDKALCVLHHADMDLALQIGAPLLMHTSQPGAG